MCEERPIWPGGSRRCPSPVLHMDIHVALNYPASCVLLKGAVQDTTLRLQVLIYHMGLTWLKPHKERMVHALLHAVSI